MAENNWNTNLQAAPEFKNVLVTVEGYDKVCLAVKWKEEWLLINSFDQKYKSDKGDVRVLAWRLLPEIYK